MLVFENDWGLTKSEEENLNNLYEKIENSVPAAALYEQLAEECCELGQACIKMSRNLRGENPPKDNLLWDLYKQVREEYSDVINVAQTLNLNADPYYIKEKANRWVTRLDAHDLLKEETK